MAFQVYHEEQHMRNSVIGYAVAGFLTFYAGIMMLIFFRNETGKNEFLIAVSISLVVLFLISWIIFTLKLDIRIDEHKITYRMPPLINSDKYIYADEIESYEVVDYHPIREYGGWGIRWSPKNGRALMTSGKTGLRLQLKNGKKLLLGTHRKDEIAAAMQGMMKNKGEDA